MYDLREHLVRMLWRGHDPLASISPDAVEDLQGWGSSHRYLGEAVEAIRPRIIVEIGVWKGGSSIHLASHLARLQIPGVVIAVDTWLGAWDHWISDAWFDHLRFSHGYPSLFHTFAANVRAAGLANYIVPLPLDSLNAAKVLRHFGVQPDVVHLDGAHDYASVKADLQVWWDVLAPGGTLIGDDYRAGNDWPEVKEAFDDFFGPLRLTPLENVADKCRVTKPRMSASGVAVPDADYRAIRESVSRWRENCRLEFLALIEDTGIGLTQLMERYVSFPGPLWDGMRRMVMDRIIRQIRATTGRDIAEQDVFGRHAEVHSSFLGEHFPSLAGSYLDPDTHEAFPKIELLPSSQNPFFRPGLRPPFNRGMARTKRPALTAHRAMDASLLVTPLGYMLFDASRGVFWPAASTRAYPTQILTQQPVEVDCPIIIVQDMFDGSNFCHFLFDWVPRIAHLIEASPEDPRQCLFLLGGVPGDFHSRVIAALCEICDLRWEQFIFPAEIGIWRSSKAIWFFSDVKLESMHPANLGNEKSVRLMHQVSQYQGTNPGEIEKIYITRNDTTLRQISNEADLWTMLRRYGFSMIRLADLSVDQQISVFRGASVVVAAHGMGLTHMALHNGNPRILELHNPNLGSDSYGFMATALGFQYHAAFGEEVDPTYGHYRVDVSAIENILIGAGITPEAVLDVPWDFGPGWYSGVQRTHASATEEIVPPVTSRIVMRHTRDDPSLQPDNNVGWWALSNLLPGATYTASCSIWIPTAFRGESVDLVSGEFLRANSARADLARRDCWQRLRFSGTVPTRSTNLVLRVSAEQSQVLYSTCWEMEPGFVPGS